MSEGGTVLLQAAGFALLAAISPTALLVMAVVTILATGSGSASEFSPWPAWPRSPTWPPPTPPRGGWRCSTGGSGTHGRTLVIYALGVGSVVLIVDGALGLSGVY